MKFIKKSILFGFVTLFVISCSDDSLNLQDSGTKEDSIESTNTEGYNEERNLFFGDTHVHTKYSFDAYIFGTTATPDDAYTFAKGGSI